MHPVILPKQGNSVETCILVKWLKQPGDAVTAGEPVCEVETDKTTVEVTSPAAGVLLAQFFPVDADVPVQTAIAAVGAAGEDPSALRPGGAAPASAAEAPASASAAPAAATVSCAVTPACPGEVSGVGSSPRARDLAAQRGVAIASVAGTGPGGLVIERDVAAVAGAPLSPTARVALPAGASAPVRGSGPAGRVLANDVQTAPAAAATAPREQPSAIPGTTEISVKGVRKVIASRMRESLSTTAQLTLFAVADAGPMLAWRERIKEQGAALGIPKLSLNDLMLFVVSRVLPRFPELNAHFLGDRIVRHPAVHLGVAVDTDKGLLVPVIRDAHRKSLVQLASEFKPLAAACQAGKADAASLSGSTFSVTNLGALGIEYFTPVLNVPEVAILGIGGLALRPERQADGTIAHVDVIHLSLTIDHQALDGAPAARFLAALIDAIEHIELILAS